jgi:hypothetical protein
MSAMRKPRSIWSPSRTAAAQFDIHATRSVETRITPTHFHHRLSDLFDVTINRHRILDRGQRIQIVFVRSQSDLAAAVDVHHASVHRAPHHLAAPPASPQTPAPKLSWIVDGGLDPRDQTELVVHLQPVVLHPMFDSGAGPAIFLATGEHLPVKLGMEPSV